MYTDPTHLQQNKTKTVLASLFLRPCLLVISKYHGVIVLLLCVINVKKLPYKFNIFVRVEMTHLKQQKLLC